MLAIYYLHDPCTEAIRYVGYTTEPGNRLIAHCSDKTNSHKANWVRKLMKAGLIPKLKVKVWVNTVDEAKRLEIALIILLRQRGCDLTNNTIGGDGATGRKMSPEQLERHRAIWTPELRNHLSTMQKGQPWSIAERASHQAADCLELRIKRGQAISAGWAKRHGKPVTRVTNGRKGKPLSEEHRAALRAGWALRRKILIEAGLQKS